MTTFWDTPRVLPLLPRNLWTRAMRQVHEEGAHHAKANTIDRALCYFYFPKMVAYAAEVVRTCRACQMKAGKGTDQRYLHWPSTSGYPFQRLSMDFVGPLPKTSKGFTYVLTVMDVFTRWLEAFPIRAATADVVVRTLTTEVFPRFGYCEQLHSDRGSQFTGDMLASVAAVLSIHHTQTPAYNPKSNPVERSHRTLKSAITALAVQWPMGSTPPNRPLCHAHNSVPGHGLRPIPTALRTRPDDKPGPRLWLSPADRRRRLYPR